jgi:hypothetical protein
MIPAEIDAIQIITDLRARGWNDSKIEVACGFSQGYIAQIRGGGIRLLSYQRAARLYNFWESEMNAPDPDQHL